MTLPSFRLLTRLELNRLQGFMAPPWEKPKDSPQTIDGTCRRIDETPMLPAPEAK